MLLAPPEKYEESEHGDIEEGRYRDEPDLIPGLDGEREDNDLSKSNGNGQSTARSFESDGRTPTTSAPYAGSSDGDEPHKMHGINPTLPVQMFTDASKFAVGCHISQLQYKSEEPTGRMFPVPILFDSMTLSPGQRNYGTY